MYHSRNLMENFSLKAVPSILKTETQKDVTQLCATPQGHSALANEQPNPAGRPDKEAKYYQKEAATERR